MDSAVGFLVGGLFLLGLIGALIPWVPGPLLILAGAAVWAAATDFVTIGAGRLVILGSLAALTFVINVAAGAAGARGSGGSRWGMAGAVVGALVGLFFGPFGLLFGPVAGAVGGELMRGTTLEGGLRTGVGALVGQLAGLVADFALGLVMIALFLWWIWRG